MIAKIVSAIEKYNMLSYGQTVIVGLSGGADSAS
jgi:tRNA(Ile)-lysidine synthase TilS/MesJ